MRKALQRLWRETDGVLSFEWTLLLTMLVIGVVGGLAAARDAVIDELGDAAEAMLALDHSYTIDRPLELLIDLDVTDGPTAEAAGLASDSGFVDAMSFTNCGRTNLLNDQPAAND